MREIYHFVIVVTIMKEKVMSNMKEWLIDLQENGDDGTGYCDMCAGCDNCTGEGEGNE